MLCPLSGDTRIQGKEDRGTDIDSYNTMTKRRRTDNIKWSKINRKF
jgi:hypothetical protein